MVAYKKYAVDVINLLSKEFNLNILPDTLTQFNEIFEFEKILANLICKVSKEHQKKMTFDDIKKSLPFVNFY